MGKAKQKRRLKLMAGLTKEEKEKEEEDSMEIPISNLPENFICMKVKAGTKIRNVIDYALKEFPKRDSVVWTGYGSAVPKVISCAEIFKRQSEVKLDQVTKIRYRQQNKIPIMAVPKKEKEDENLAPVEMKTDENDVSEETQKNPEEIKNTNEDESEGNKKVDKNRTDMKHPVLEVYILQAKDIKDTRQSGYQAPGDKGEFSSSQNSAQSSKSGTGDDRGGSNVTCIDAKQFEAMGLRTGQKRQKKGQQQTMSPMRSKKKKNDDQ